MKNIAYMLSLAAGLVLAACGGNDPFEEKDKEEEETVVLNPPSNLQIHTVTHNSVIVYWQGDSTALFHDVFVSGGDTIPVASTSCGIDGLQQKTTYNWYVRARRGGTTTAFVAGPPFTTEDYSDVMAAWEGEWNNRGWDGSITLFGNEVPYSDFSAFMPDSLNPARMEAMNLKIEETEDSNLAITFPTLPVAGPFPTGRVVFPLDGDRATLEQELSNTIPFVREPVPVADLPFLDDMSGMSDLLAEYGDIAITEFTVNLTKFTFTLGPPAADTIPALITIDGTAKMSTDDALLNAVLDLLLPNDNLKIKITTTLYRKEE
ncbi:MAG: fibronectin type III domain-containing protein [Odoribacteraceae bacterium]|jgi:hypothetical protein|nr:fibronectin type III domain-containing protein [Odoribacteraceae bacterium]